MNWKHALSGTIGGAMLFAATASALAEDVVIKLWARADRSGPLRAGNIVAAADTLNKMLAATGTDKRVKVELNGVTILDTDLSKVTEYMANSPHPGKDRTSGYFGFAGHNDPVEFRNISIMRLSAN